MTKYIALFLVSLAAFPCLAQSYSGSEELLTVITPDGEEIQVTQSELDALVATERLREARINAAQIGGALGGLTAGIGSSLAIAFVGASANESVVFWTLISVPTLAAGGAIVGPYLVNQGLGWKSSVVGLGAGSMALVGAFVGFFAFSLIGAGASPTTAFFINPFTGLTLGAAGGAALGAWVGIRGAELIE